MKKYEKYKDSGIELLGKIPESWDKTKLKYYLSIQSGGGINNSEIDENGEYFVYGGNGIMGRTNNINSSGEVLIIGRVGALCGNVHLVNDDIWISDNALWGKSNQNQKFLYYYLKYLDLNRLANKNAQPLITGTMVKEQIIGLPTKAEQTDIASFLDHKTTQIDALIEKKEQLIEKLKLQRQAIINEAVTKGLNPDVPGKDSGVEWLGEIPKHWEVVCLKYIGIIKYGLSQLPPEKEYGLPVIRATNVFRGKISKNKLVFVSPEDVPYERDPILKEKDIVVVRSGAYTADSAIIPHEFDGAVIGYDMALRCNKQDESTFISYCLLSDYVLNRQLLPHSLRAAQPHLNREELGETLIVRPNEDEQTAIVHHIETQCSHIDAIITKLKQQIDLFKEYRTALISEAVTGKIDIRDHALDNASA